MTRRLTDAPGDKALGGRVGAVVLDAATGAQTFASNPDTGITPAFITKIIAWRATLSALSSDIHFSTRVVQALLGPMILSGDGATLFGPTAKDSNLSK